jgi:hypothetical protein
MAVGVVDGLEAVEVDVEEPDPVVVLAGRGHHRLQSIVKAGPVEQTRQGIDLGHLAQVHLLALALGHVLDHDDDTPDGAMASNCGM